MIRILFLPVLIVFLCLPASRAGEKKTSWLSRYDIADKHPRQFKLPKRLREASGVTMSDGGKLFGHDDESGVVYQIDLSTGGIVKMFSLGSGFVREDFEDIAIRKDTMYLVASNGTLFEFREANDKGRVDFRVYRTALSRKNDVEGLVYDPDTDCLLLACKGFSGKGLSQYKAVYAFSLKTKKLLEETRFLIPLEEVNKKARKRGFNPSGIARHPRSGTYFVISSDGESIIEIDGKGMLLGQQSIPKSVNNQPEGITFAPDLSLILCNDGQGGTGTLTVYPLKP